MWVNRTGIGHVRALKMVRGEVCDRYSCGALWGRTPAFPIVPVEGGIAIAQDPLGERVKSDGRAPSCMRHHRFTSV